MREPELITRSIRALARDPGVSLVTFVFDVPQREDKAGAARNFIKHVAEGFKSIDKPGLLTSHTFAAVSAEGRKLVDDFDIAYTGAGISLTLNALAHVLRDHKEDAPLPLKASTEVSTAQRPQSERDTLDYLASSGVGVIPGRVVTSSADAVAAARAFHGPVVLKIASPDIQHKTEVGGVVLNLVGGGAVAAAYDAIMGRVALAKPEARLDGAIVSPMRPPGLEIIVGTMRDPQWGPAIAVGLGGTWVEVLKDTSLRLLPVSDSDVLQMLGELRGSPLLDGFRGAPRVDRAALARTVVAIGKAALALGPDLVALEVNPLLISSQGIEALDALAVWSNS
jgi:acyl-CoA synthetase (NDP forming)